MNDKPIFKIRFILCVAMPTAAKIQYSFSEELIPLFQQTMQPEKEVETLKIILILAPEKKHSQNDPVRDKQTLITHFQRNPVPLAVLPIQCQDFTMPINLLMPRLTENDRSS